MGKTKTSQKQEKFLGPSVKPLKASKAGAARLRKLKDHNPTERLADTDFVVRALVECLLEGDEVAFKEILKDHYEAANITEILEIVDLPQRTFFEAVSPTGNPSLKTIIKMFKGLGVAAFREKVDDIASSVGVKVHV